MQMQCPEGSVLHDFVQCALSEAAYLEVEEHISVCIRCRQNVEELERNETRIQDFSDSFRGSVSPWSRARRKAEEELMAQKMLSLPFSIPPYLLTEPLGQGGMGEIYAGEHQVLKRKFAVKLIRQRKLLEPAVVERFHQEITAAGKLDHPNIVSVTDAGLWDGMPYLVMELLEGQTLTEYVHQRGGKLPLHEAKELILQAAAGLQHAHERGLIHCDVKPSNLWRMPDGTLKVLDLGLAQTAEKFENETTHLIFGTPSFMAPEQYVPQAKIDARADVYALGSVFFYLLTGMTQGGCISRQIRFPQVREAGISIPRALQLVLDRMTDPIAVRRFASMKDAAYAIRKLPRFSSRKPRALFFLALGTFAAGAFLGHSVDFPSSHSRHETTADPRAVPVLPSSSGNVVSSQTQRTQNTAETQNAPETQNTAEDPDGASVLNSAAALEDAARQRAERQQNAAELADTRNFVGKFQNELRRYEQKAKEKIAELTSPESQFFSGNPNVDFIADLTLQVNLNEFIQEFRDQVPKPADLDTLAAGDSLEVRPPSPEVTEYLEFLKKFDCLDKYQSPLVRGLVNAYCDIAKLHWEKGIEVDGLSSFPELSALLLWPYYLHGKYAPNIPGLEKKLRANVLKLAEEGNTLAFFWLGCEQWYGMQCPVDREEGLKWFRKAAESAETDESRPSVLASFYFLGRAYDLGISVPKDRTTALEFYLKADRTAPALAMLGVAFLQGDGVPKDEKMAFSLFERSADQCIEGAYMKAYCLENGLGCETDADLAFKAYQWAHKLELVYGETYGIQLIPRYGLKDFPSEIYAQRIHEHQGIKKWKEVPFRTLEFLTHAALSDDEEPEDADPDGIKSDGIKSDGVPSPTE